MNKKYIAITMAMLLGASIMGGCGQSTGSQTTGSTSEVSTAAVSQEAAAADNKETMIFGQVSELTDDSITISVENSDEKKTIAVTSDTVFEKASMGQGSGMPDGQPPAKPGEESQDQTNGDSQEKSDEKSQAQSDGQPPAKPDGDMSDESAENSTGDTAGSDQKASGGQQESDSQKNDNSQSSSGQKPDGQPPRMQTEDIEASDIQEGDTVAIESDDDGNAAKITLMPMGQGGPGGNGSSGGSQGPDGGPGGESQSAPESYEAVNTYTEDTEVSGETISSTGTDENAIHVSDGASVKISDSKISRTSDDSDSNNTSSFYGTGTAILTTEGTSYIKNCQIDTDANGGAGVFSYGDGVSYVSDTTIKTSQGTSGGIHVAGGGTLYAWDTEVETNGQSSAAIRSDKGGGTIVADGGSYTSNGTGSPAIYSTADIAVNNAVLTATGSEAICIEGKNSIHLYNSDLTGDMKDDSQNDTTWNVILYQSMSGDSEEGNSTFEMDGGSITAKNGGMFYTTNTESTFTLKDVDITGAEDAEFFLRCTGNQNQRGWGDAGANGADCLFTAIEQEMEGDIQWDSISELDFYMTDGSTLSGAVVNDESCAGDGGDGYCNLYIDKDSTWIVTGDSTLTTLSCAGKITDDAGKTVTIKGSDGTVYVKGDSSYTVTVKEYKDSADTSGASTLTPWSKYQQDKPEEL